MVNMQDTSEIIVREWEDPICIRPRKAASPADASHIAGKVICGYQGWFGTPSDGSGEGRWRHWGGGSPENLERVSFELYPDIREYTREDLHPTGYDRHGNGQISSLFSSYSAQTVNIHFRWMAEYGIDGVALQRFYSDIPSPRMRQVMQNVRQAAEQYHRIFYICYDISGGRGEEFVSRICQDIDRLKEWVLDSPSYLHEEGRPVLQLWGFGVKGNCRCTPEQALEVVEYARRQSFYLIVGTPAGFRESGTDSLPEFAPVYEKFDMISPWQVGRFGKCEEVAPYYDRLLRLDGEYCEAKGQGYMPVLFAGFAWSLWLHGPKNAIPRLGGRFFWEQAKAAARIHTTALYIAMFDEYDESTAIMKAAEDSSQIPQGKYFLTTCADGMFVSSDFYLRLVGKLTGLYREKKEFPEHVPVPLTEGPVYLRTGFEAQTDAMATIRLLDGEEGYVRASVEKTEKAHGGDSVLSIGMTPSMTKTNLLLGILETGGYTITPTMTLRAFVYPLDEGGCGIEWDVMTTDGQWLSETGEIPDETAMELSVGKWKKMTVPLGKALAGKTIQTIALRYRGDAGKKASLYVDDILLYD